MSHMFPPCYAAVCRREPRLARSLGCLTVTQTQWQPASIARRFGALVVDWLLCLLIARLFSDPLRQGWAPVVVLIAEYGFFLGLFTQTPGMRLTKIRCVGFATGRPIGVPRALLRGFLLALVIPAVITDGDRRGLHDRAVGSVVIAAFSADRPA